MAESSIPTYKTAANVLSKQTGSGIKMVGWTLARTLLIAPPILLVTDSSQHRRVWIGAGLSSLLISTFALLRIYNASATGIGGRKALSGRRRRACRSLRCAS